VRLANVGRENKFLQAGARRLTILERQQHGFHSTQEEEQGPLRMLHLSNTTEAENGGQCMR